MNIIHRTTDAESIDVIEMYGEIVMANSPSIREQIQEIINRGKGQVIIDLKDVNFMELDAARNLLRAAGAIKVKEDQGYYRFYYGEELLEVLRSAGFVNCEAVSSLANQAFVASATK
jgi:anti-anti-sigma factor